MHAPLSPDLLLPDTAGIPEVCAACDHPNPADSRFCNACGAPVHLRPCPACETINEGASSHCYKCGSLLRIAGHVPMPSTDGEGGCDGGGTGGTMSREATPPPQNDAASDAPGDAASDAPGDAASDAPGDAASAAHGDVNRDREGVIPPHVDVQPVHFIGGLTARSDEAELTEPDLALATSPRRGGARRTAVAALLVVAATAGAYYIVDDPARRDRVLGPVRALISRYAPPVMADKTNGTPREGSLSAGAIAESAPAPPQSAAAPAPDAIGVETPAETATTPPASERNVVAPVSSLKKGATPSRLARGTTPPARSSTSARIGSRQAGPRPVAPGSRGTAPRPLPGARQGLQVASGDRRPCPSGGVACRSAAGRTGKD